ncbi:MAG: exodeoxyribonuclease VII small subunit [Bdellovibrionales bacterium]|mgnify:CR=1 FL=1|jgi:exodeoxyribonuclease VII small subunit|nr:exodeoxyribonuclease VII small subunit [Bdellovibrionales bacterium]MBT3525569.1 exodeoxyribonuclease VII small subunit [Bdellovibrionales bacterium]MBT7670265.1 exodeoxyribonuclease VII small subunit [Bdellovibrionales bacterium]MBT7767348.1 exodeoxyribonuclease VII small subunit [Bdellovibrionales bacterium]
MDFETKMKRLESIVTTLEDGALTLEDSIEKFEEGVSLFKDCQERLAKSERKIKKLTDSLKDEEL